ncbi:MAG: fatty acid desaturase [Hyphomicrobiaceae bacterium]|jgi:fatty acid desaturase
MEQELTIARLYSRSKTGPAAIDAGTLAEFQGCDPLHTAAAIGGNWLAIVSAVTAATLWPGMVTALATIIFLGSRQLALWVLAHEAVHGLLLRDHSQNDQLAKFTLAGPIGLNFDEFRRLHFLHHKHVGTDQDPEHRLANYREFQFPMSRFKLATILIGDLCGANFLRYRLSSASGAQSLGKIAVGLAAIYWLLPSIGAALAFWVIAHATWFQMVLRLRLMFEHQGDDVGPLRTRTVLAYPPERLLFIPGHVNFHIEHHLYPAVPAHRLRALHTLLSQRAAYRDVAATRHGWLNTLGEFIQAPRG